nr:MAG TPA: hypothetical protein [Caudoviricetes sp.]
MMTKERFRLFMRFSRFKNNEFCYFVVFIITNICYFQKCYSQIL